MGKGQKERDTQNPKQAPGSELSAQSSMKGSNPQTARSRPEPKSDTYSTEPPRRPDEQTLLINFNLINKRRLAIRVVHDAGCHVITTAPMVLLFLAAGLWGITSRAWRLGLRPWCLAEISDFSEHQKVPTTGTRVFFVPSKYLWTALCFSRQEKA